MKKQIALTSKLGNLCQHILEAGWLAAIILTALFFDVYSSGGTEPSKVLLIRTLATTMAVVWLVYWLETRHLARTEKFWRAPLAVPVLLFALAYLVASFTSIVPRISWLGEYQRPEGTYTISSYLIIFAIMAQGLRTRAQLDRLTWTLLWTSVPVALYAILQYLQLDPLEMIDHGGRAQSSLGNPMFLGAYALLAFFLAAGKAVSAWKNSSRLQVGLYALVALLQLLAIILSGSRGPFVAWLAALVLGALLFSAVTQRTTWIRGIVIAGLVGFGALFIINLPGSPFASLRTVPGLGRLLNLAPEAGSSGDARSWYWRGASQLVAPHAPLQFPDGSLDGLNVVRPLVGYGPDTFLETFTQFYPPAMRAFGVRDEMLDRSHNETWNALATIGIFGFLAYQFLFVSICVYVLRVLGLMSTSRDRNLFFGLWVGLGVFAGLGVWVIGRAEYAGLAMPLGTLAAVVVYLARFGLRARVVNTTQVSREQQILLIALLTGILAHYIELQFGIAVTVTRTLFWVFVALTVALGSREFPREEETLVTKNRNVLVYGSIAALILICNLFDFVIFTEGVLDPLAILWRALSMVRGAPSFAMLGLFGATFAFMLASVWVEFRNVGALVRAGLVALGLAAIFEIALLWQISEIARVSQVTLTVEQLAAYADQFVNLLNTFLVMLLVWLALMVFGLMRVHEQPAGWAINRASWVALCAALVVAFVWNTTFNLNPLRADVVLRLAERYGQRNDWRASVALYPTLIRLSPNEDIYFQLFGRALAKLSDTARNEETGRFNARTNLGDIFALDAPTLVALNRNDVLLAAQAMLLRARELNPLFTDHAINLARFYLPALPINTDTRKQLADTADKYYAQAFRQSPANVVLLNEWAKFVLDYRSDPAGALEKYNASLKLDPGFDETYAGIGAVYAKQENWSASLGAYQKAFAASPSLDNYLALGDAYKRVADWKQAVATMEEAIQKYPTAPKAYSSLAFAYYQAGRVDDAIKMFTRYTELASDAPNVWEAHKNLALIYQQTGNVRAAIQQGERAFELAPDDAKPQLNELLQQWRAQSR